MMLQLQCESHMWHHSINKKWQISVDIVFVPDSIGQPSLNRKRHCEKQKADQDKPLTSEVKTTDLLK